MNVFKTILGVIVAAFGLSMTATGWAVAFHGQWATVINAFLGFTLAFLGLGLGWVGIMLVRGSTIRDTLGGIVTARSGQSGIGLHKGDTYHAPPSNIKEILLDVLKYTIIAVAVILIAIFSIFRAIGGLPVGK